MTFDLLAKRDAESRLSVRVDPEGFTVPQTLELRLTRPERAEQVFSAVFNSKDVLRFDVSLVQGAYTVQMRLAGGPHEVRILGIVVSER